MAVDGDGDGDADAGADADADPEVDIDRDPDPEEFEDLPNTDIEVDLHVHYGMTGSFPLRMADLFFADDGLYVVEYSYLTPLFGLATRKHRREASAMQRIYEVHGLDEVLLQGDTTVWHNYANVESVVVHAGGAVGRPKITVYPREGGSHAYRLHDDLDPDDLAEDLQAVASEYGFEFERREGVGFSPAENVRRFLDTE